MSTNVISLGAWGNDSPWRRLRWTLPAALSIWIAVLWTFAYFMGNPSERLPEPPAIEAQLIEIPAPTVVAPPEEKRPAPPVKPVTPSKPQTKQLTTSPQPKIEKNTSPSQDEKPAVAPSVSIPPASPRKEEPAATNANLTATGGAQAIVRPMPQIPDELRQDALSVSAVARFRVAMDGTATVELVKPTPNPRLNRLLLDTLKNWRFFPAMKDGKPVPSMEEIVIKLEVK